MHCHSLRKIVTRLSFVALTFLLLGDQVLSKFHYDKGERKNAQIEIYDNAQRNNEKGIENMTSIKKDERTEGTDEEEGEEEKRHTNEEKRQSNKLDDDEDDELEKETSELLNINVSADGKIVEQKNKHKFSKEAILEKENLLPYLKIPPRNNTDLLILRKNKTNPVSNVEARKLMNDITVLKNDLRSSLMTSNKMISQKIDDELYSNLNLRKKSFIKLGNIINSSLPQAMLLDTMSPMKKTIIPAHAQTLGYIPAHAKYNDSKASLLKEEPQTSSAFKKASFFQLKDNNRYHIIPKLRKYTNTKSNVFEDSTRENSYKLNTTQNQLVKDMFKPAHFRPAENKRLLHSKLETKYNYRNEDAVKKSINKNILHAHTQVT